MKEYGVNQRHPLRKFYSPGTPAQEDALAPHHVATIPPVKVGVTLQDAGPAATPHTAKDEEEAEEAAADTPREETEDTPHHAAATTGTADSAKDLPTEAAGVVMTVAEAEEITVMTDASPLLMINDLLTVTARGQAVDTTNHAVEVAAVADATMNPQGGITMINEAATVVTNTVGPRLEVAVVELLLGITGTTMIVARGLVVAVDGISKLPDPRVTGVDDKVNQEKVDKKPPRPPRSRTN
ncbi:hypothetical protein H072_8703 [Dactylellina haptotyla CBS 200.50]|uniref:Uncharacterized protein n=1 Tax=Dactylellina haptotyla (strain CBS 200.50) TaxID=1284197 RepID=S8A912_DACHA|nr:hypothetical protein H072_8703 [Dactylellina haptotyla CBS 200.50]